MEPPQDALTKVTDASIVWTYAPIANLTLLDALPPAARERETKKTAETFASTGRNVFVHYATPILEERRKRLLASGLRKKKYSKTAAQLWQCVGHDEDFYWNEAARSLRQSMKQGSLSLKGCLIHGGRVGERENYLFHAEVAVAAYLELPTPIEKNGTDEDVLTCTSENKVVEGLTSNLHHVEAAPSAGEKVSTADVVAETQSVELLNALTTRWGENKTESVIPNFEQAVITTIAGNDTLEADVTAEIEHFELLDTLPEPFEYDQKMLFSHFAHYDYNLIRKAEGKHQTAMLRQLADLFDRTGKILFYYYVVPRLCKEAYPPIAGDTVTGDAAKLWRYLPGVEKEKWCNASASVKKRLGDGDMAGLDVLELGSLDAEVLRLHELARSTHAGTM